MNEAIKRMIEKYHTTTWQGSERALREILQEITLVALWRANFFEQAAFYGGTALRILYGLDRFSEDLDFTLLKPNPNFNWSSLSAAIIDEIESYEFNVNMIEKDKTTDSQIRSAFLKTNTFHSLMNIGLSKDNMLGLHSEKSLRIKIEIDIDPIIGFDIEKKYIKEPIPVSISSVIEPDLFASKLHAALYRAWKKRVKGRDWYDVIWFISRGIPLNLSYFIQCMRKINGWKENQTLNGKGLVELANERINMIDIEAAKKDVSPFLKKPELTTEWTSDYFKYWISQIKIY